MFAVYLAVMFVAHSSSALSFLAACPQRADPKRNQVQEMQIPLAHPLCPAVQSFQGAQQQSPEPTPSTNSAPTLPTLPPASGAGTASSSTGSTTTLGAFAQCGGIADGHTEDAAWPGYSCPAPATCQRWSTSWWQCRSTAFGRRLLQ